MLDKMCCAARIRGLSNLSIIYAEKLIFEHQAQAMIDRQVEFLNQVCFALRNANCEITKRSQIPAVLARQRNPGHPPALRHLCCQAHIACMARGTDANETITLYTQNPNQLSKSQFRRNVVGERGAEGRKTCERDNWQSSLKSIAQIGAQRGWVRVQLARFAESLEEFTCPMFRIRCAATVTANQRLPAAPEGRAQDLECAFQIVPADLQDRVTIN